MLCVNQKERWTANQLLEHPWIKAGDDVLAHTDLTKSIDTLKKFNRKRKFKAAADAIIASNRMRNILDRMIKVAKEVDSESGNDIEPDQEDNNLPSYVK